MSILAEPPVALVDKCGRQRQPEKGAGLFGLPLFDEGQRIAARYYFRPTQPGALKKFAGDFPAISTFTLKETFGTWDEAQKKPFRRRRIVRPNLFHGEMNGPIQEA